jgi:protein TonB
MEALMATLDDPSEPVREAATWALSHVKDPNGQDPKLADTPPKPLLITRARYPADAFQNKVQGAVILDILINSLGRVAHAEVRQSLPGLDEAALACVRDWTFQPATRGGRPVPAVAQAPVSFRIF